MNAPAFANAKSLNLQRYDTHAPRYTSYPSANHFSSRFAREHWDAAIYAGNEQSLPLSLYLHIPFCANVCYYCGCNRIVSGRREIAQPYVAALEQEISLRSRQINPGRLVNQMHWGGGTPTYLEDAQIARLVEHCRNHFEFADDLSGEFALEVHPQTVTTTRLARLRAIGFNRLSMGVQDFDPQVQKAVNRFNSALEVKRLLQAARAEGYRSVSLDLIYGLPHQTPQQFAATVAQVLSMRPDRVSLFSYAHMPQMFKMQRQIASTALPAPSMKLQMLETSVSQLLQAGYLYIGMDHFALPSDTLTQALHEGSLHRNFQGYTTHAECDLLGFGVSSVSSAGDVYVQNHKTLETYYQSLQQDQLPFAKGHALSRDDQVRRAVIQALMCRGELSLTRFEQQWRLNFKEYFGAELKRLQPFADDGLITIDANGLFVTEPGRYLVRNLCATFDAYLKTGPACQQSYAKSV